MHGKCPPNSSRLAEIVGDLWWYGLRTPPQKEFVAQAILARKGIATFCPADRRWRRRNGYARHKQLVSYPMLPRLVFAGFVPGLPAWFDLFRLPAIQGAIGIAGRPARMDEAGMLRLLARYPNGIQRPDEERFMRTHAEFKAGEVVRICDGPFDGMAVPVHEIRGSEARVLLELFGAQHEVAIAVDKLEKAA